MNISPEDIYTNKLVLKSDLKSNVRGLEIKSDLQINFKSFKNPRKMLVLKLCLIAIVSFHI